METDKKEGAAEGGKEGEAGEPAKPSKAPEALSHRLDNPCRVTPAQQKFVALEEGSRWRPIHPARPLTGIIVFKDLQPGALLSDAETTGHIPAALLPLACCQVSIGKLPPLLPILLLTSPDISSSCQAIFHPTASEWLHHARLALYVLRCCGVAGHAVMWRL